MPGTPEKTPGENQMALRSTRHTTLSPADRPAVDEWGIYDPSQAGLEALYDLLETRRRAGIGPVGPSVAVSMEDANRFAALAPKSSLK
jgi:hypothetical protein